MNDSSYEYSSEEDDWSEPENGFLNDSVELRPKFQPEPPKFQPEPPKPKIVPFTGSLLSRALSKVVDLCVRREGFLEKIQSLPKEVKGRVYVVLFKTVNPLLWKLIFQDPIRPRLKPVAERHPLVQTTFSDAVVAPLIYQGQAQQGNRIFRIGFYEEHDHKCSKSFSSKKWLYECVDNLGERLTKPHRSQEESCYSIDQNNTILPQPEPFGRVKMWRIVLEEEEIDPPEWWITDDVVMPKSFYDRINHSPYMDYVCPIPQSRLHPSTDVAYELKVLYCPDAMFGDLKWEPHGDGTRFYRL